MRMLKRTAESWMPWYRRIGWIQTIGRWFVIALLLTVIGGFFVSSCVNRINLAADRSVAVNAAEMYGFRDVVVHEPGSWFITSCGHGEDVQYYATALNSRGIRVRLTVCCGVFTSCTVRVP